MEGQRPMTTPLFSSGPREGTHSITVMSSKTAYTLKKIQRQSKPQSQTPCYQQGYKKTLKSIKD